MTVHAILVTPPRAGLVLSDLVETSPITAEEAADLYAAMVRDVVLASAGSGGDTLVNYRPDESLPEEYVTDESAEAATARLVADAVDDPDEVRYEVQVGSTHAARAGNTATHLLEEEDADGVAILDPRAPTMSRRVLDGAAMKLRSNEVVVAPGQGGRAPYLGLTEPIDFEGAYGVPELTTLAGRAVDAGLSIDFVETLPVVETGDDLATLLPVVEARLRADRWVPPFTAAMLEEFDLRVVEEEGSRSVARS